jgi:uncharacterized FlaG/YvyC family protein
MFSGSADVDAKETTAMEVSAIDGMGAISSQPSTPIQPRAVDALQQAVAAARRLNLMGTAGREFAVTRDPATLKFVIVIRDRDTGAVIDQLPPEDALKLSEQLAAGTAPQKADKSE